jgi:hypothetical protein
VILGVGQTEVMGERTKTFFGALFAVAAASAGLGSCDSTNRILVDPPFLRTMAWIALGPMTGWIGAAHDNHLSSAFWSLVPATLFSLGPLVLWIRSRYLFWLVVATFVWVLAGYFYAVAMWV